MHVCTCVGLHSKVSMGIRGQLGGVSPSILSSRNQTQSVRLGGKLLYRLSHLVHPLCIFLLFSQTHSHKVSIIAKLKHHNSEDSFIVPSVIDISFHCVKS